MLQTIFNILLENAEMVVIVINSGFTVYQQGSSSLYSGLFTKNTVLETKQESPAIDSSSYHSLVGGSVQESCSTGLSKVFKNILEKVIVVVDFLAGNQKLVKKLVNFRVQ
jgi:hypothetical protein